VINTAKHLRHVASLTNKIKMQQQTYEEGETNRAGGVVGVHVGAEPRVQLRAAVHRPRRLARDDPRHGVERERAHVQQHRGDVQQRREEEHRLPPQQCREHRPGHPPRRAAAAATVGDPRPRRRRCRRRGPRDAPRRTHLRGRPAAPASAGAGAGPSRHL